MRNLTTAMKISSAGAWEARIWKCRADGQPGFLESLSFCLLSDSSTERGFREFMEGKVLRAFLEIPPADVWSNAALAFQQEYKFPSVSYIAQFQGHTNRILLTRFFFSFHCTGTTICYWVLNLQEHILKESELYVLSKRLYDSLLLCYNVDHHTHTSIHNTHTRHTHTRCIILVFYN